MTLYGAELVDFRIYTTDEPPPFDQPIIICPECGKLGQQGDDSVIHKARLTLRRGGGCNLEVLEECETCQQ